jgi:hypothetical protein
VSAMRGHHTACFSLASHKGYVTLRAGAEWRSCAAAGKASLQEPCAVTANAWCQAFLFHYMLTDAGHAVHPSLREVWLGLHNSGRILCFSIHAPLCEESQEHCVSTWIPGYGPGQL